MTKQVFMFSLSQIEEALIAYAQDCGLITCEEGQSIAIRDIDFTAWSDECGQTVAVYPHNAELTVERS